MLLIVWIRVLLYFTCSIELCSYISKHGEGAIGTKSCIKTLKVRRRGHFLLHSSWFSLIGSCWCTNFRIILDRTTAGRLCYQYDILKMRSYICNIIRHHTIEALNMAMRYLIKTRTLLESSRVIWEHLASKYLYCTMICISWTTVWSIYS